MRRVLVLGGGFGGVAVCRGLRQLGGEVLVVDRQNHHLFQPLLYQVATAGLGGTDIAQPLRSIFKDQPNVTVRMGTVAAIDLARRHASLAESGDAIAYDWLVIALGAVTNWFGHPEWSRHALGLKTLADAMAIRARVLGAFERAECTEDPRQRARLMTLAVVGGGPMGVEVAGACSDLARFALRGEFRRIRPADARIVLIEASDRLIAAFSPRLAAKALAALTAMGVEVWLRSPVTAMGPGWVECGERRIEAETVVWASGVEAPAVTRSLGVELDRAGRIKTLPDLSIPGHPEAFAIGDIASVLDASGKFLPGLAPAAMQAGRHVAKLILEDELEGPRPPERREPFRYLNKGIMATIGRSRAVFQWWKVELSGWIAWLGWLLVHLLALIDLRSKLAVLIQWIYAYLRYRPGARIIYRHEDKEG